MTQAEQDTIVRKSRFKAFADRATYAMEYTKFLGYPVKELDRDELLIVVGFLAEELRKSEGRSSYWRPDHFSSGT